MSVRKSAPLILTCTLTAVLSACGGGSSGSNSASSPSNADPYMVKTVVTYTDNTYATINTIKPTAEGIPGGSAAGLFTTSATLTNGSYTYGPKNFLTSASQLAVYNNSPATAADSSREIITGGYNNWPNSRFGLFETRDVTAANTRTYIDMPYAVVSSTPSSPNSATYSNAVGKIAGLLAAPTPNGGFPLIFCDATASLTVTGSTKQVVLSYTGCKDSISSGVPSGTAYTTAGTITLSTSDDTIFTVTGTGVSLTVGGVTFTPASYRGNFLLGGSTGSELVGRVYMADSTGNKHASFAFGVKK